MLSSLRKVKFSIIECLFIKSIHYSRNNLTCFTNRTFYHAGQKTSDWHHLEELRKAWNDRLLNVSHVNNHNVWHHFINLHLWTVTLNLRISSETYLKILGTNKNYRKNIDEFLYHLRVKKMFLWLKMHKQ